MPKKLPPSDPRPLKREVTVRTTHITADDFALLQDLDAVAHLRRTSRDAVVADIIQRTLGPKFAPHVAAA